MNSNEEFWTPGNLMALGAREIVKRHEAEIQTMRAELAAARAERDEHKRHMAAVMKRESTLQGELAALKAERDIHHANQEIERDRAALRAPESRRAGTMGKWIRSAGNAE